MHDPSRGFPPTIPSGERFASPPPTFRSLSYITRPRFYDAEPVVLPTRLPLLAEGSSHSHSEGGGKVSRTPIHAPEALSLNTSVSHRLRVCAHPPVKDWSTWRVMETTAAKRFWPLFIRTDLGTGETPVHSNGLGLNNPHRLPHIHAGSDMATCTFE